MHVINQPWGGRGDQMGDHIIRLLTQDKPRFEVFRACVAFVKASGVLRLAPALQAFMDRGGRVEIVAGVDEGITTRQALELLMKYSTAAYVFSNPVATFHPKMYLFEIPRERAVVFVGSSNLTAGGLYTNYEVNLGVEFDLTVETERELYESVLAAFRNASDVTMGNARRLDRAVLSELHHARKVVDETRRTGRRLARGLLPMSAPPLFPRTPVPPAPRIDLSLAKLIPRVKLTGDVEADQEAVTAFRPWEMFVMILGVRDTRQKPGYSRDVYIPLAARDFDQEFWGWPGKFRPGSDTTVGTYPARRIDMVVRPASGQVQVVEGVRLYYYDVKHEFRLNCSRLIEGAKRGDLLLIHKSPADTLFNGGTYEFEATIIPSERPGYQTFRKECRNRVKGSSKRWGYL
ncbi:MAG: hypothetical protein HYZ81_23950 [Nitrospinae bacterium]|nr:hypothetical protein [Nitrospinota bacterium]